jgi:hypothetical protein
MLDPLPHIIDSLPTPDTTLQLVSEEPPTVLRSINRMMGRNETPDIKNSPFPTKLSTIGSRHFRYDNDVQQIDLPPGPEPPFSSDGSTIPVHGYKVGLNLL